MSEQSKPSDSTDPRVELALREYFERVDRGEVVNRDEFLLRHLEIAAALRSFFAVEEPLRKMAATRITDESSSVSTQSVAARGQETVPPRLPAGGAPGTAGSGLAGQFGRYQILRALGKGAMGAVYLAHDSRLERKVAIKTPHFADGLTDELLARFYREAHAAATLRHASICPIYDVGEIDGKHFISMAYIDGRPLSDLIHGSKPQNERRILIVVHKLAHALQHAHDQGIVHRDLKPANVMVDKQGEPIIMDFGLARKRRTEGEASLTQSGLLLGSPAYMSPEQIEADPEKVGPAADQYSLGVVLYELLTGQLPFRGSVVNVLAQIITRGPTPPSQLRPGLDPRIEAVCLRMLAKKAADRFPSMKAVADQLASIAKNPAPASTGLAPNVSGKPASVSPPPAGRAAATDDAGASQIRKSLKQKVLTETDLTSLEELVRKCLRRRDYDQMVQIIERIPEDRRSESLQTLLEQAREKLDEISFLICEIDEAERLGDRQTALRKADDLLRIKPGHHRAQAVQEKYSGYGGGGAARIGLRQFTQPWSEGGWVPWSVIGGGVAVFCAMTAFIVLPYLKRTTLTVQVDDRQVTVALKGQAGEVTWPSTQKFTVEAGDQELTVAYRGAELATRVIRLKTGNSKTVVFSVVDQHVVMKSDGDEFTFEPKEKIGPAQPPLAKKTEKKQIQLARIQAVKPPAAAPVVPSPTPASAPSSPPEKSASPAAAGPPPVPPLVAPFGREAAGKARQQWAAALKEPAESTNSIGMTLALIPPGEFLMGSTPDQVRPFLPGVYAEKRETFGNDQYPQHRVRISRPYRMGTCEVTRGQFAAFVRATRYKTEGERDGRGGWGPGLKTGKERRSKAFTWRNPGYSQRDSHPVVDVSWNDAVAFCEWLSQKEGKTYRLPTEAEWEYACRAGTTTVFSNGDDPEKLVEVANIQDVSASGRAQTNGSDGYKWTAPVGSFRPNAFGLYDMHGNVWEWCQDRYDEAYYGHSAETDPTGPSAGDRVSRGGALDCPPHYCLSAGRDRLNASERTGNLGFRVVATVDPFISPSAKIAQSAAALAEGFVPLFDGKSLAGWKTHASQPGNWRVENGVLVGSGSPASHLYTRRSDFKDFDLRVEARINEGGNSGVNFRTSFGPRWPEKSPQFPRGYEAQIDSSNHPAKTGSLFEASGQAVVSIRDPLVPPGQWFAMEVIAQGSHIVIKVNGREVVRHDDSHFGTGHIALQQLEPQTVVEFRKIEIKELGAGAP